MRRRREETRRRFLGRTGALLASTALPFSTAELLAACGGSSPGGGGPTRGGHLTVGMLADATNLLPSMTADTESQAIGALLFSPPVQGYLDGSYAPALAEAMPAVGPDKRTFTFRLRGGLRWSDGRPLTAQDVAFTFRLLYDPAYAGVNSPFRAQWVENVAGVTALDDRTVQLRTKRVYALYLQLLSNYPILPQHVLGNLTGVQINTAPFQEAPDVSLGPFRFGRWDRDQQIVVDRDPGYPVAPVHLDKVVFRVLGGQSGIANGLRTGEVDFGLVDLGFVDSLRQSGLQIISLPSPQTYSLSFQLDPAKPASRLFGDKRVRQALAHAVDRSQILKAVLFGYGDVTNSIVPVDSWGYDPGVTPAYDHDPRKAAQLLDAAGWRAGPSGIRSREGQALQFGLLYTLGVPTDSGIVQAIQQQWKSLGVDARLKGVTQNELVDILSTTRDFDAGMLRFSFAGDPEYPFSLLLSSAARQPGGFNITGYSSPQMDQGISEGAQLLDQAQRKPVYQRLQRLVAQDVPMAPLIAPHLVYAATTRVRDVIYRRTFDAGQAYVTDRK